MKYNHHQVEKIFVSFVFLLKITFIFNSKVYSSIIENPLKIEVSYPNSRLEETLEGIFDSNECLLTKSDAKSILINDYEEESTIVPDDQQ